MNTQEHWNAAYEKGEQRLSWTEAEPRLSLSLISEACAADRVPCRVIDVGGGASVLSARLLERGYQVTVLDISPAGIEIARKRLGPDAEKIEWIVADITSGPKLGHFDVWHDRAVFHFLTTPEQRSAYVAVLKRALVVGGHAVIATFAVEGPLMCSGLDVCRYDGESLAAELGPEFRIVKSLEETHMTPWGAPQAFQYSVFPRLRF